MGKAKKKLTWWQILLIALAVIVTAGGFLAILDANADEKTVNGFGWEVAAVDEQGRVYESDAAMVTDYISVNELSIEYGKDAEIVYRVHLYTEDKEFVETSLDLTADYEYKAADGSEIVYARIEADVPADDKDGAISFLEKFEYAKQLTITYNPDLIEIDTAA